MEMVWGKGGGHLLAVVLILHIHAYIQMHTDIHTGAYKYNAKV